MSDYPATLPLPDSGNYAGAIDYGLVQTQVPAVVGEQRRYFNRGRETLTFTFHFNSDELLTFSVWAVAQGWDWFNMPVVSSHAPVDITSTHRVRFTSPMTSRKAGHDYNRVTIQAEIWPGDMTDPLAPVITYDDFIEAGSPPAPAADDYQAGTPAAPATDFVVADLYPLGGIG